MNKAISLIDFDQLCIRQKNKTGRSEFWYRDIMEIYVDKVWKCVILKLSDGKEHSFDVPLQVFDDHLPAIFFRCNRSVIVNLWYMAKNWIADKRLTIFMKDGNSYLVSRSRHMVFHAKMSETSIDLPEDKCLTCRLCKTNLVAM